MNFPRQPPADSRRGQINLRRICAGTHKFYRGAALAKQPSGVVNFLLQSWIFQQIPREIAEKGQNTAGFFSRCPLRNTNPAAERPAGEGGKFCWKIVRRQRKNLDGTLDTMAQNIEKLTNSIFEIKNNDIRNFFGNLQLFLHFFRSSQRRQAEKLPKSRGTLNLRI